MKFATALSTAAFACANLVSADSQPFHFLSIRSGSQFQYATVYLDHDVFYLGSNPDAKESVVTDEGYLKYGEKFVSIRDNGFLSVVDSKEAANDTFSISGGLLNFNGASLAAVPDGDHFALGICPMRQGSVGIAIRAQGKGADAVPDFPVHPSAAQHKEQKGEIVSQIGDGQIQAPDVPKQSSNGVGKQGLTFGAGLVAAAALLL